MLADYSSNAILTKARAMYGKRLKPENYKDLLRKHSVSEVAAYLKNETAYSKSLSGIQENLIHRGQLENLIRRDTLMKFVRLARYDSSDNKGFYYYFIINLEAEQILSCLKLMDSGLLESYIETLPGYLLEYVSFDIIKLAHARNFEDILEVLARTDYYRVLEPCRPQPGETLDLFKCEYELRQYYYDKTFELIEEHYKGEQQEQLKQIFQHQIILGNISSIYRLKRFFRADAEQIEKRILKTHNSRTDRHMEFLINTKDVDAMLRALKVMKESNFFTADDFSSIELAGQKTRFAINKRFMTFSSHPSVVFAAYMLLSQIEIENIISIIEGIRYNIPETEIEQLLAI